MDVIKANTPEELANELAKAAKLKRWHVFTGQFNGKPCEIKAYGLWLQIFRVGGIDFAAPEFKTQKALKQYVIESITPAIAQVRKIKDYLLKGHGIYSGTMGGRYFDARVNAAGNLECFDGYDDENRTGWIEFPAYPAMLKWHGPNGEPVYI